MTWGGKFHYMHWIVNILPNFAVAAVFSLAYKLQPAIIFIDEVDSFLGQRRSTDHEALANMKTEFMALWDGFTTDREYLNFLNIWFILLDFYFT